MINYFNYSLTAKISKTY